MVQLEEALQIILAAVAPLGKELISLEQAAGRVAAETLDAPCDLPLFDNAAMDGYAVRAEDLHATSPANPVCLALAGRVAAGEAFAGSLPPRSCLRVLTGSPLPQGADAVVMQEETRSTSDVPPQVCFPASVTARENVRFRGEDVKRGAPLVDAGDRISATMIGLLSAAGIREAPVGRRPKVAVLATGSELIEPGQPLPPGRIYESNRWMLAALVNQAGGLPLLYPFVQDTLADTQRALETAFDACDVVVTSGGVSVGELDHLRSAFEQAGGRLDLGQVAIKPGRPFVFGRLGSRFLFGLPGNPVSALVTCLLLVRPALLRMQGSHDLDLPRQTGRLAEPLVNGGDRRHFMRVYLDREGEVRPAGLQASHALTSLARSNGLVDVPPQTAWDTGTTVQVLRMHG